MSITPFSSASGGYTNTTNFPDIPANDSAMRAQFQIPITELASYINATVLNGTGTINADAAAVGSVLALGWILANETWTYASANTITVPTGAALRYQKTDRLMWTQHGTLKYGVVLAVADTLLTILINTDFVVENTSTYPITLNYYSHQASPVGYPAFFNVAAPTFAAIDNGSGGQPTTTNNRVSIVGSMCFVHYRGNGTKDGASTNFACPASVYPPTANSADRALIGSSYVQSPTDTPIIGNVIQISGTLYFTHQTGMTDNQVIANWTYQLMYEI